MTPARDRSDDEASTRGAGRPRVGRPRPVLGALVLGLLAVLLLAGPSALVGWRLLETEARTATMPAVHHAALDHATVARAAEGLRGLTRQIRHAAPGPSGAEARRQALARLRVLTADPLWRAGLPPDFGVALETATAAAARLATASARQTLWHALIAAALDRLERLAQSAPTPGPTVDADDAAPGRAVLLARLHAVLAQAGAASGPALSVLEADARRLAARAIAAGPDPDAPRLGGSPFAIHGAIAEALDIPAYRRADLSDQVTRDTLWAQADGALARAADIALQAAETGLRGADGVLSAETARLRAALLALGLAGTAVLLAVGWIALAGHARPLARLVARARALGFEPANRPAVGESASWATLERLVTATEADAAVDRAARDAEADARRDQETLSGALLGAAPEAVVGRNLAEAARVLDGLLDAVRAQATLARSEARLLSTPGGGRRDDVSSERAALAAHLVGEACAALADQAGEAAHLVSALRLMSSPEAGGRGRAPLAMDRVMREVATVLTPRLASRGVRLDLRCPMSATVEAAPGILTAVVCYIIEAAMLRAEDAVDRTADAPTFPLSGIVVDVALGSDARVRLTIDDDGPMPAEGLLALIHPPRMARGLRRAPERLAHALREAPDAAALLLADGLARAALGEALDIVEGAGRGTRVSLSLPLQAGDGPDDSLPPDWTRDDSGEDPGLPMIRTGLTRG
ncbi:HAMP domain-containing histidine kinase [Roseospira navarrensis]|uniref:Uncharacterized protein n=1 Tax=Roseospira navarrensis TaxID=140058 RepID=A0A7X1ZEU6_9PROT|nr:HAMP domain-containing histidine kinase [Roseospira navarrensis]MQX36107.1 hypothetical protein [Roseospira navarrensis]